MIWSSPHPLIEKLNLSPHPEGGFYREVYKSEYEVRSPSHHLARPAATHIYFLLLKGQISRFHKVLHDEIWNFYAGAPLRLYQINQQQLHEFQLGGGDMQFSAVVPGGYYQAAVSTGDYSLLGCTVAPGFDFTDFSFVEEPSVRQWLEVSHPDMIRFL